MNDQRLIHDINQPFPLVRYRFICKVKRPFVLPEFAGSALRGIFGHSLKKLACVTGLPACNDCALRFSCPYTQVFESQAPVDNQRRVYRGVPNPFIVEPKDWGRRNYGNGKRFEFNVVLIGPALSQLSLIIESFSRALLSIGPAQGAAELVEVLTENQNIPVWSIDSKSVKAHQRTMSIPQAPANLKEVTMCFTTPLRLMKKGKRVDRKLITAHDILNGLVRRVATLTEMQLGKETGIDFSSLSEIAKQGEVTGDCDWVEWRRFSNRQKRHIEGGGLIGNLVLTGSLEPFWSFLYLGQYLHLGKMSSFGNGRYILAS